MTPTEKHRETAREVAELAIDQCEGCGCDDCLGNVERIIAAALAQAGREGMKLAAEMIRDQIMVVCAREQLSLDQALRIRDAVLSEAGEEA